jgi:AraC-like DNA-binding protein
MINTFELKNINFMAKESQLDFLCNEVLVFKIFGILYCNKGQAEISINSKTHILTEHSLTLLNPNSYVCVNSKTKDFNVFFLCFSDTIIMKSSVQSTHSFIEFIIINNVFSLNEKDSEVVFNFCKILLCINNEDDNDYKENNAINILKCIMNLIYYKFFKKNNTESFSSQFNHSNELLNNFMYEVDLHYKENHNVDFYAKKLCISTKYLSSITRKYMNRSPKDIICEKLFFAAHNLLTSSNMTIQEISDNLGFVSQSYFGLFFKRYSHLSPIQYRIKQQ